MNPEQEHEHLRVWNELLRPYQGPDRARSLWQLGNTAALFVGLWALMYKSLSVSYWLTLLLAVPAAFMLVRLFIIQHDCGHGSFFRSRKAADAVGFVLGVVTLVPYSYWRRSHAIHHATSGNLDHREFGDIDTLTVREYQALPKGRRLAYRLYRHPVVLFLIGPVYQFVFKHRLPLDAPRTWRREWWSIAWTNLALAAAVALLWATLGLKSFLLVHAPIILISGSAGVWLFYVQHQFVETYWDPDHEWSFFRAALEGSSYYDLPAVLHWFTGNIGYHHIHHLSSRIPNYRLARCQREIPQLSLASKITLFESLRTARLKLWDEAQRKMVSFRELQALPAPASEA
ncbi:MAG TPA: fatty acid desaturase [Thermoanaerobaculia bacterium]|nr:fatty acid desaturase [Thermoanaerobaculia bacterium]